VAEHAVTVHVAGAVVRPGVVTLPAGSRAVDAVSAAGGLAAGADPDRVNLAAALSDGQRLVIPLVGQPPPAEFVPSPPPTGAGSAAGSPATQGPVDLNTATEPDLDRLPGIGPATAAAIVSHRSLHGPFRTVEDLLDVRGIGEAKLDALRGLVSVSP
jgi:competence protein ComEA